MTYEIIVRNPSINQTEQYYRRFTNSPDHREQLTDFLETFNISPSTHPTFIELFAGDAPSAVLLRDLGWSVSRMTCVDLCISLTPLVPDATWKYWDLHALYDAIKYKGKIPTEINQYKGKFDIAIEQFSQLKDYIEPDDLGLVLSRYFARKGGFIFTHRPPTTKIRE